MKWFLLLVLLLPSLLIAEPKQTREVLPSVEWQKSVLKRDLENKVKEVLNTALQTNEFVVQARVELATPKMPDFKARPNNQNGDDKKKARSPIKDTSSPWENDPYGYVVFHKLGLEAPLLEDFKDFISK